MSIASLEVWRALVCRPASVKTVSVTATRTDLGRFRQERINWGYNGTARDGDAIAVHRPASHSEIGIDGPVDDTLPRYARIILQMHLLTPHAFGELFCFAESAAVVGSASSILRMNNGAMIDACDLVVRFNRATTSTDLAAQIGTRTDLLCVTVENLVHFAENPAQLPAGIRCLLCFTSPDSVRRRGIVAPDHLDLPVPVFATFGPDPYRIQSRVGGRSRPMTTGTYSLFTLTRALSLRKLFVTGFTMFGAGGGSADKYFNDPQSNDGLYHDLDSEARVFADVLYGFTGELEMTDEVAEVVAHGQLGSKLQRKSSSSLTVRGLKAMSHRLLQASLRLRRAAEIRTRHL